MNTYPSWDRITELKTNLHAEQLDHWLNHELFSFGWWFILAYNAAAFFIGWKLFDKNRIFELFTSFGIVAAIVSLFDAFGGTFVLFSYPTRLLPLFPPLFSAGFIVLPFLYTLLYQMCSKWTSFLVASALLALFLSFIIEPLLQWLNIYQQVNWSSLCSFAVYMLIALVLKWLMGIITKAHRKSFGYE